MGAHHLCAHNATICHMISVASRDLRNHTADVLRRVAAGEQVSITVHGRVVAEIVPPADARAPYLTKHEVLDIVRHRQADPGLAQDLRELADETTDDLGPIR